jgi:hypothetical protein
MASLTKLFHDGKLHGCFAYMLRKLDRARTVANERWSGPPSPKTTHCGQESHCCPHRHLQVPWFLSTLSATTCMFTRVLESTACEDLTKTNNVQTADTNIRHSLLVPSFIPNPFLSIP